MTQHHWAPRDQSAPASTGSWWTRLKARLTGPSLSVSNPGFRAPTRPADQEQRSPVAPDRPIDSVPSAPTPRVHVPPEAAGAMPIVASSDPALLPPEPIDHVEWEPRPRPVGSTRPPAEGWFVRLDDGREFDLDRLVLMGRCPEPMPTEVGALLVPIGEDGQAVSKTHLSLAVDERGAYLVDRGSTNGTALVSTSGRLEPLLPGIRSRVMAGQRVSLGQRWFTVERRD